MLALVPKLRRAWFGVMAAVLFSSLIVGPLHPQTAPDTSSKRRLVYRTTPPYPPLARSLALAGVVRLEAVVSADGSVKTAESKGGHPVLAQAAINAVRQWKWEPAAAESHEQVQVKFSPEQ